MPLDSALCNTESPRYLAVTHRLRHEVQHLFFAPGEHACASLLADRAIAGNGNRDRLVAGLGTAEGREQVTLADPLVQEGAHPATQHRRDDLLVVVHAQDDHPRARGDTSKPHHGHDRVAAGHLYVQEHDIRRGSRRQGHYGIPVVGFAYHSETALGVEDVAQRLPQQGMVIGDNHADFIRHGHRSPR